VAEQLTVRSTAPLRWGSRGAAQRFDETGLASQLVADARARAVQMRAGALEVARHFAERSVPFVFGAKGADAIDCSGLISRCYQPLLPDGVTRQHGVLVDWTVDEAPPWLCEEGDLLFFSEGGRVGHVAILESCLSVDEVVVIHASGNQGRVTRQTLLPASRPVLVGYEVARLTKMWPFLVRSALDTSIREAVRLADS
jgi:hypothetical protein